VVCLAVVFLPLTARAQLGCAAATCTVEITMPVNDVLRMTLSTASVGLGTPALGDFTVGYRDVTGAAATVTAKSNRAFRVQVVGGSANFSYGGSLPNPSKPASDLKWATTQGGLAATTFTMGTAATLINSAASAPMSQSIYFRTLWLFNRDVPGSYSLIVSFTLAAP
jgi:hypothetical protein